MEVQIFIQDFIDALSKFDTKLTRTNLIIG